MKTKILLVDDEPSGLDSFGTLLRESGYDVVTAGSRKEAQEIWIATEDLRIALVDLHMPDNVEPKADPSNTGFRLIKVLRSRGNTGGTLGPSPAMAISAYSGYESHENLTEAARCNCDGFICKTWEVDRRLESVASLEQHVHASTALSAYSKALTRRNPYTAGHCERTVALCRKIVPHLVTATPDVFDLCACLTAAKIHDIGKLGMPDEILVGANSKLTREERKTIQKHVNIHALLDPLGGGFHRITEIVYYHHRHYADPDNPDDLSDYPKDDKDRNPAPRKDQIPLEARLLKVADTVDAIMSDRLYSPGQSLDATKAILKRGKRKQFDPDVVDAFLRFCDEPDAKKQIDEIVEFGRIKRTHTLALFYDVELLTAGMLGNMIESLSDIWLEEGRAVDRLKVSTVAPPTTGGGPKSGWSLALDGSEQDVDSLFKILSQRIEEKETFLKNAKGAGIHDTDAATFFLRKSTPIAVNVLDCGGKVVESYRPSMPVAKA